MSWVPYVKKKAFNVCSPGFQSCFPIGFWPPVLPFCNGNVYPLPLYFVSMCLLMFSGIYSQEFTLSLSGNFGLGLFFVYINFFFFLDLGVSAI